MGAELGLIHPPQKKFEHSCRGEKKSLPGWTAPLVVAIAAPARLIVGSVRIRVGLWSRSRRLALMF